MKNTNITRRLLPGSTAVAALLLAPGVAAAHPMPGVGDFYAGMLHPVTAIEFLLPMIALGLLAGQQNRRSAITMLACFPAALAVGAVLANPSHVPSVVGWVNLGSMAALGLLVAAARPLPAGISVALSFLVGLAIGVANGAELGGQLSDYRFVLGLALAGLMLVSYGIGCVRRLRAPWMLIGFRVVGSWIAAVGILVLALR